MDQPKLMHKIIFFRIEYFTLIVLLHNLGPKNKNVDLGTALPILGLLYSIHLFD